MIKKATLQILFILMLPIIGFSQPTEFVILNGTDESIVMESSNSVNAVTLNHRTVELYLRVDNNQTTTKQVVYEEGGAFHGLNIWIQGGSIYLGMWSQEAVSPQWFGTWFRADVESNKWYHVALVLDNTPSNINPGGLKWYLDGVLQDEGRSSTLYSRGQSGQIGHLLGDSYQPLSNDGNFTGDKYEAITDQSGNLSNVSFFKGAIGNFRIWNSSRSQEQINDNKSIKITTLNVAPENMVAYLEGNRIKYVENNSLIFTNSAGTAFPLNTPPTGVTTVWNGKADETWTNSGNWETAVIPVDGDNVEINTFVDVNNSNNLSFAPSLSH